MEWADDIAYSVHDLEDFYRAGLLPLDRLVRDKDEQTEFLGASKDRWGKLALDAGKAMLALAILNMAPGELHRPYRGGRAQRAELRLFTSLLIARYVKGIEVIQTDGGPQLHFPEEFHAEVTVLKELMRHYVFCDPALAAQQHGHRQVIRELFAAFAEAAHRTDGTSRAIIPVSFRELLEDAENDLDAGARDALRTRIAADVVASLTEQQAVAIHRRLRGLDPGTIHDLITA